MRLAYGSDLHLEHGRGNLVVPECDVLLLPGDVFSPHAARKNMWGDRRKYAKRYDKFWKEVSERVGHCYMVAGNHEYYGGTVEDTLPLVREFTDYPNVTLMENDVVEFYGFQLFGATLWTDVDNNHPLTALQVNGGMNDYNQVRTGDRYMSVYDTMEMNTTSRLQLNKFLDSKPDTPLVMTHHAPFMDSVDPKYRDDELTYAYVNTRLLDPFDSQELMWFHGHSHYQTEYKFGNVIVACNPRGYFGSKSVNKWDFKMFDVETS